MADIIELGVDEGDTEEVLQSVAQYLHNLTAQMKEFTGVTEKYNTKGTITQQTLRGLDGELAKVSATFKNTKEGLVLIAQASDRATSRLKELQAASSQVREGLVFNRNTARNEASAQAIRGSLSDALRGGNDTSTASTSELNAFNSKINSITNKVASGLPVSAINDVFTRFKSGATEFTVQEQKIIKLFNDAINAANNFGTASENAANRAARAAATQTRANQVGITQLAQARAKAQAQATSQSNNQQLLGAGQAAVSGIFGSQLASAGPKQVVAFNNALQTSFGLLQRNKVTLSEFVGILQNVKAGNIQSGLVGPLNQVQNGAFRASNAIKTLGDDGDHAGKRIFLSFQNVIRIFESQLLYSAFSHLTSAITGSIDASAEYARRITLVQTISQDANVSFEQWYGSIRKVADAFGVPAVDAAIASYDLLSNQVTRGAETTNILAKAVEFGRTTNTSATDSVNLFSSAINSFDLKATDADRVARTFFATIDKGRVTGSELANSFGRSGTLANSLGISLEELQSGISTLTRQGIKGNEAYTLLNNLFIKFIKPTDELQGFLKKLGYETGQAAFAALGMSGVLKALDKEFAGDTSKVAKFFDEIRGGRGALNLTGQGLKDFLSDLAAIRGSSGQFDVAKGLVSEGFGQKFFDEIERIKNFFLIDVGHKIAESLVNLKDNLGGFVPIVSKIVEVFKLAAIAAAGFYVTRGIVAVIGGFTHLIDIVQGTIAVYRTLGAAAALTNVTSLLGINSIAVGAGVIVGAISAAVTAYNDMQSAAIAAYKAATESAEASTKSVVDAEQEAGDKRNQILEESLTKAKQGYLAYATEIRQTISALSKDLIESQKDVTAGIQNSFDRLRTILSDTISDITNKAHKASDTAAKAREAASDAKDELTKDIFTDRFERAKSSGNIPLQEELIEKRIAQLRAQGKKATEAGDLKDLQKAYAEINNLLSKQAALKFRIQTIRLVQRPVTRRELIIGGEGATAKVKRPQDFLARGPVQRISATRLDTVEGQRIFLAKELIALEEQLARRSEQTAESAQAEADKVTAKVEAVKDKLKELQTFDIRKKDGTIKPEFSGEDGEAKAVAKLSALQTAVDKSLEEIGASVPERAESAKNFGNLLAGIRAQFAQQAAGLKKDFDLQAEAKALAERERDITNGAKAAAEKMRDFRDAITESVRQSSKLKGDVQALSVLLSTSFKTFGLNLPTSPEATLNKSFDAFNKQAANSTGTPQDIAALKKSLADLLQEALQISRVTGRNVLDTIVKPANPADPEAQQAKTLGNVIGDLQRKLDTLTAKGVEAQTLSHQLYLATQSLVGLSEEAPTAGEKLKTALDPNIGLAKQLADELARVKDNAASLVDVQSRVNSIKASTSGNASGKSSGGLIGHFASGGFLSDFLAGKFSKGTDTVPTMLSPGEFVTNAQQTKNFLPLLRAINSGEISRSQTVNHSTTNVGDINVTVKGGSTSEATVKDIAQSLRRGLRRGTIKL